MKKHNNKKGQLTLYIIIGLIILITMMFALTIIDRQDVSVATTRDFPEQVKSVQLYVDRCLKDTLSKGIKIIGSQGGYIDPPSAGIFPTEGDGVDFFLDGSLVIPYWWYLESSNSEKRFRFNSKRPPLRNAPDSIEAQLERYVEANVEKCIDLDSFEMDIKNTKKLNAKVMITDDSVIAKLYYPVEIVVSSGKKEMELFDAKVSVHLPAIYKLATEITNAQANMSLLELYTMNLIAGYSGLDKDKLPPTDASSYDPATYVMWTRSDVKEKLKEILASYIPLIQVYGSMNFNFNDYDNDLEKMLYSMRILRLKNETIFPYEIDFNYLSFWDIYLNIEGRGAQGEIIGPERASVSFFPWLAISRYQLYYDVSFPVVVEIKDPFAFEDRGFSFLFAIEANLRDNFPIDTSKKPLDENSEAVGSLFCNYNVKVSDDITFNTLDAMTNESIGNIALQYYCGDSCTIGITSEHGTMDARLPMCYGGKVLVQSEKYWAKPVALTSKKNTKKTVDIYLYPIRYINATIIKKSIVKKGDSWVFEDYKDRIDKDAEVFVFIQRIKKDEMEKDISSGFILRGNDSYMVEDGLKLVPGEYKVSIGNIRHTSVTVPEEEICEDTGVIFSDEECTTLDKIELDDPVPFGGVSFNDQEVNGNTAYYWNVSASILYQAKDVRMITLFFPDKYTTLTHDDLSELGKLDAYSARYRPQLEPEFS